LVEAQFLSVTMFGNQDFIGMAKGKIAEGGRIPDVSAWSLG